MTNSKNEEAKMTKNGNREIRDDELKQVAGGAFPLFFFFANSSSTDRPSISIQKLLD